MESTFYDGILYAFDICYHKFPSGSKTFEISSVSQILGPSIIFVNHTLL